AVAVLTRQIGVEVGDLAPAGCLRPVERDVGVRQDLADVDTVGRSVGDSDADGGRQLAPRGVNCLTEHTMQLVGDGNRRLFVRSRKGDDELVAADAAGHAVAGYAALDSVGD